MSLKKNYKEYKILFENVGINTNSYVKYLNSLKRNEEVRKNLIVIFISLQVLLLLLVKKPGDAVAIILIIELFGGGIGLIGLFNMKNKITSFLDKIFFNEFLIKNIKIFYSIDELSNVTYNKIKHVDIKVHNAHNANQAVIELSYIGYLKGAEGIILTNMDSTEAILIKNIKERFAFK